MGFLFIKNIWSTNWSNLSHALLGWNSRTKYFSVCWNEKSMGSSSVKYSKYTLWWILIVARFVRVLFVTSHPDKICAFSIIGETLGPSILSREWSGIWHLCQILSKALFNQMKRSYACGAKVMRKHLYHWIIQQLRLNHFRQQMLDMTQFLYRLLQDQNLN